MTEVKIAVFLFIHLSTLNVIVLSLAPLTPIVIPDATYNKPYRNTANTFLEYVFVYQESNNTSLEGSRIEVKSADATHALPLIVVIRQKQGTLSWVIPYQIESQTSAGPKIQTYNTTTRTLCSSKFYVSQYNNSNEFVTVSISTASYVNVSFELTMFLVSDFYLEMEKDKSAIISPSEPIYYGYIFPKENKNTSVIVQAVSDSDVCMTMSIQKAKCPVFDLEHNVQLSGYWQTVSRKGALSISREEFPSGFFIVLVVKVDDTDCSGSPTASEPRTKKVTITIKSSVSQKDGFIAFAVATTVIFFFCFVYMTGTFYMKIKRKKIKMREESMNQISDNQVASLSLPASSTSVINTTIISSEMHEDSSIDEDDGIDMMEDAFSNKQIIRTKLVLSVCDLARKEPRVLWHKSRLYLYYLITVSVFYALPVVQLVTTNQYVLHLTGNQDLCYYNFLCAHPWSVLSDFNHVYSNCGYILLGALFTFITYAREKDHIDDMKSCYGIPQHYGLFYAMGVALIMEGVLSGCYHVCPNHTNFQFDTSFMYIISVLCMVKIYQTRHPDINARAPVTFGVLAVTILLGLVGVLKGTIIYWILFTMIHLSVCLILSAQIYYMGTWKFNGGVFRRVIMNMKHDALSGVRYLFRPVYLNRFFLLVIGNLVNIGLAIFGNMHHKKDFATYLLAVLMVNLLLYTFFYIIMKLCHKERILLQPLIYIILSFVTWSAALYFFINKTISWSLTPAQSRIYNKPCILLNFFDSHDIWHFLSAFAMFFSFMGLLTLDDDLIDVHRSQIPVF